jgi:predicted transcriptional regulator
MREQIEKLMADQDYRKVIFIVLENPYIEKKALAEQSNINMEKLESILKKLLEEMVLLELASQADSSVESRVPKKIYLVNPEMETEIRSLFS